LTALGLQPDIALEFKNMRANEALSAEAAYLLNEINTKFPRKRGHGSNPARAPGIVEILRHIPGGPYRCPPSIFAATALLIERQLRWLRNTLRRNVFRDDPGEWQTMPQWNEDSVAEIALLINNLAKHTQTK
jgi:hypothetical protein